MMSKSLLARLIWHKLGKCVWLTALWSVILFFAFPVVALLSSTIYRSNPNYVLSHHPTDDLLNFNNPVCLYFVLIAAVVTALVIFHYINKKTQVDFFHSQPVSRGTLFFSNYISGLLIFLVPYAFFWGTALISASAGYRGFALDMPTIVSAFLVTALFYAVCYSVTVLACTLSGNSAIALFVTFVFFSYGPTAKSCIDLVMERFFKTFYYGYPSYGGKTISLSPVSHFSGFFLNNHDNTSPPPSFMIFYLALTVFLMALAYFLYRKRSSESSGNPLSFSFFRPVIKLALMTVIMIISGLIFYDLKRTPRVDLVLFGVISAQLASFVILNTVFHFDFKAFFRGWKSLLVFSAAFVLVFFGMKLNISSYNEATVKTDNVKSFSFNVPNNISSPTYRYPVVLKDEKNIEAAVKLHRLAAEKSNKIKYHEKEYSHLSFVFNRKFGFDFSRKYQLLRSEIEPYSSIILQSEEYEHQAVVVPLNAAKSSPSLNVQIEVANFNLTDKALQDGLIDAMLADAATSDGNIFHTESDKHFVSIYFGNEYTCLRVPIGDHLTNTTAFMLENNIPLEPNS